MDKSSQLNIDKWDDKRVEKFLRNTCQCSDEIVQIFLKEKIDGTALLALNEHDLRALRTEYRYESLRLGDIKRIWTAVRELKKSTGHHQQQHGNYVDSLGYLHHVHHSHPLLHHDSSLQTSDGLSDRITPPCSIDGRATCKPDIWKTVVSLGYAFLVTWVTAFVMVVVHERVPDMQKYPPLPDIFLDNVPIIPWAFQMCEITGAILFMIWTCVLVVHKHRFILLRRFFALGGTVFLLRCVTMLITSLSVPGTHLNCKPNPAEYEPSDNLVEMIERRFIRAYLIWSKMGMSIHGIQSCGDYMYSGHTSALTLLNFFITEYTPRNLYFLHTLTWLLNMFGIFFILAGHEHYSIDVFVAFYITSRLFLYYHTLANNHALMSHDSNRTRIWFPMFSYFESSVDGIIPNEYENAADICKQLYDGLIYVKDMFMLTTRRYWIMPENNAKLRRKRLVRSESYSNFHTTRAATTNNCNNTLKLENTAPVCRSMINLTTDCEPQSITNVGTSPPVVKIKES